MDDEPKTNFEKFKSYAIPASQVFIILLVIIVIGWFAIVEFKRAVTSTFVGYQVASDVLGDDRPPAFLSNKYADQSGNHRRWYTPQISTFRDYSMSDDIYLDSTAPLLPANYSELKSIYSTQKY